MMTLVGAIILIGFTIVAVNVTFVSARTSRKVEEGEIKVNMETHKQLIQNVIRDAHDQLNGITESALLISERSENPRSEINDVLIAHTKSNRDLLGLWMIWDPNILGADTDYINDTGSNVVGQYVPYWHWSGDSIVVEVDMFYDTLIFYDIPKRTRRTTLFDPYYFKVSGADSLLISLIVPILKDGQFLGIAGADISLNEIRNIVNQIGKTEEGTAELIGANGMYIAHPDQSKVGTVVRHIAGDTTGISGYSIDEIDDQSNLSKVRFMTGVEFGQLSKPWYLILTVPETVITSDFDNVRFNILMVTGVSALLILFLIVYNEMRWRQDQSEKLHYQKELSLSDARLTSFIESPETFSIYSLDKQMCYTGFNSLHKREMKETFKSDVAVGKNILKLIPMEMRDNARNNYKRALSGEQFTVTSIFNGEYFSQIYNPVYDQNSQVVGLTSSVFNVTDRIIAEKEIEKYKDHLEELVADRTRELTMQKEFSQKIVDQVPAMIFVRGMDGNYQIVNQKMAESVGLEIKDMVGRSVFDSHPNEAEARRFLTEDKEIVETGIVVREEMAYRWPDGTNRWLLFNKTKMMINDQPFILGVHFDITDVKEAELKLNRANEELQDAVEKLKSAQMRLVESEKMASLGQLTAGLAHEINNPINYVAGNIQPIKRDLKEILQLIDFILNEKADDKLTKHYQDLEMVFEEVENLLNGIADGAERVITLMDNLKSFSVPVYEAQGEVNLNYCLTTTVNLIQYQAGRRIQFHTDLSNLPRIQGNVDQLKQVFLNLLTNAIHAIPSNGDISIRSLVQGDEIIILIKDTGMGIKDTHLNRIFDPFFTTKDVGQGTGLGLSISYRIISEHGGRIFVKETSENGTVFQISFPIEAE